MKPNNKRAKIAEQLIWIVTGLQMAFLISTFLQYLLLKNISNGVFTSIEQANFNDMRQLIISVMYSIAFIVSAVTFIQWFRRAYYNQEILFVHMGTTNGWAAGAWFVPIMNLFKPYQMMKELYFNAENRLVDNGLETEKKNRFTIIGSWWTMWIVLSISNRILSAVSNNSQVVDVMIGASIFSMVLSFLFLPLGILAVKTIRNYNEMELKLMDSQDGNQPALKNQDLLDSYL